jgi:uracil-DNA glycosylase family 4
MARRTQKKRHGNPPIKQNMGERISESLQRKLTARLEFYEDLGIGLFYRDRRTDSREPATISKTQHSEISEEEIILAKRTATPAKNPAALPLDRGSSLFDAVVKISGETLPVIREDLGECTRCKLHKTRNKIVFGDGNPMAQLVFIGEGPGADEDAQGLPFVGRAGKLLTQMIQAMGLQRSDVYICNVVKCRPPQNRQPDKDEVEACSPFLLRQIDTIAPKVIVCLGATAAKLLLETDQGISQYRGQWLNFRGRKLMATYHPAYLLRNPAAKSEVWKDLQKVMAELGLEVRKGKSSA